MLEICSEMLQVESELHEGRCKVIFNVYLGTKKVMEQKPKVKFESN